MKYIALIPLLITTVCPVFAANVVNDDNKGCNVSTLLTTDGSVELIADWSINTINLAWYNNDERMNVDAASQSCKYGDVIKIPTVQPRHGYNLVGWRVRQPSAFDLSGLSQYVAGNGYYARSTYYGSDLCFDNSDSRYQDSCSNDVFTQDLTELNDWKTTFPDYAVRGIAECSSEQGGSEPWPINPSTYQRDTYVYDETNRKHFISHDSGSNCWCRIIGYDAEKDGTYVDVTSSSWVLYNDMGWNCDIYCAESCAENLTKGEKLNAFRQAMFGIQQ